jgi:hypothetical protein
MVTGELPALVSVTDRIVLGFIARLPKVKEVGFPESVRTCAMPLPESTALSGEFGALMTSVREPLMLPAEAGVKPNVNVAEPPVAKVSGRASPLTVKPEPLTVASVMVRLAVPEFLTVTVCVLMRPTVRLSNATLAGTTESCG